jgi:hypothetical protein
MSLSPLLSHIAGCAHSLAHPSSLWAKYIYAKADEKGALSSEWESAFFVCFSMYVFCSKGAKGGGGVLLHLGTAFIWAPPSSGHHYNWAQPTSGHHYNWAQPTSGHHMGILQNESQW